jgi:hypothetical protein
VVAEIENERARKIAALQNQIDALKAPPKRSAFSRLRGLLLAGAIILAPYSFAWMLLRKGSSVRSRLIAFGWLGIFVFAIATAKPAPPTKASTPAPAAQAPVAQAPVPIDPDRHVKDTAAALARFVVLRAMKDPDSAQFGQVWGMADGIACGFVNGKNSFGAMTGEQQFISGAA